MEYLSKEDLERDMVIQAHMDESASDSEGSSHDSSSSSQDCDVSDSD